MRLVAAIVLALSAWTPAAAAPTVNAEFASTEAVLAWINGYRAKPDPSRLPEAIRSLSRLGAFHDPETAGVYVGFAAGLLANHPHRAAEFVGKMVTIKPEHHWVVVRAVAYSGLPQWRTLLREFSPQMPARQALIEKYLTGKLATLEQISYETPGFWDRMRDKFAKPRKDKDATLVVTPDVLDTFWGYYFATGAYLPVARIVAMLPWSKDRDDLERLTLGNMAKYTLALNATRKADLLAMLKWARTQYAAKKMEKDDDEEEKRKVLRAVLDEVIEAADSVDTAKLRREALASIDDYRRKGPGFKQDATLWGQVGQGAIALGCIGAAAVGAVALGLPCVVGGAMSSAALNYFTR